MSKRQAVKAHLYVVVIMGNPKYINNRRAQNYYNDIKEYLEEQMVDEIAFDPGEDGTIPDPSADFFIGHSRGTGRARFMSEENQKRFLKFGYLDGYLHPKDREWQENGFPGGKPPKEHFILTDEQKQAIDEMIEYALHNPKDT